MKGNYTSLNYYFQWLISRSRDGKMVRPLEQAQENYFRMSAFRRALRVLARLGKIVFQKAQDGSIGTVTIVDDGPIVPRRSNMELEAESREVVAVIDIDNLTLRHQELTGLQVIDPEEACRAIQLYAQKLGKLVRTEMHITTKTRVHFRKDGEEQICGIFDIIEFCDKLDVAVVIVPPRPQASDQQMENILDLARRCRSVKSLVIASNDSGFKDVCRKIRECGKEAHLITSAFSVNGLVAAANKSVSLFSLLKEIHLKARPETKRQVLDLRNRYIIPVVRFKENKANFVPATADEELVQDCYRGVTLFVPEGLEGGRWISFNLMVLKVWGRIRSKWEERGVTEKDCRNALSALRQAEVLREREVTYPGTGDRGKGFFT